MFGRVNPRKACKIEFADQFWLPFPNQPQSDVVVFAIIYCDIYNLFLTECKHGISTNDILKFNETFEILWTEIVELTNVDKYSHK